jgi:hypothetical protein
MTQGGKKAQNSFSALQATISALFHSGFPTPSEVKRRRLEELRRNEDEAAAREPVVGLKETIAKGRPSWTC